MEAPLKTSFEVDALRPASFETLFAGERDRLLSALCLMTRDRHEAEEVAQDAFVRVLERWDRDGAPDDPVAYLFRTAMNVLRNRRRRAAVALRHAVSRSMSRDELDEVETHDVVIRALGSLTPSQRAALVLTDLLDMTSDEAAAALGIRPSTVRVLAARARAALSDQIGAFDG
jgi:RNA polymerase sigma-70 factor, ECF subfamily